MRPAGEYNTTRGEALYQRPAVLNFSVPRQPATTSRDNRPIEESSDEYDCELLSSDSDEGNKRSTSRRGGGRRGSPKKRELIYDLLEFSLRNFSALDEFFQEIGLSKGSQLSEADFRRALTRLEPDSPRLADRMVNDEGWLPDSFQAQIMEACKLQRHMLRVRYLKHTLKPFMDAWLHCCTSKRSMPT